MFRIGPTIIFPMNNFSHQIKVGFDGIGLLAQGFHKTSPFQDFQKRVFLVQLVKKNGKLVGQCVIFVLFLGKKGQSDLPDDDRRDYALQGGSLIVVTIDSETRTMVSRPDVISRGFVYVREAEQLIDKVKDIAADAVEDCLTRRNVDWSMMKNNVKAGVARYIYEGTKRNPMILPIIEEI